MPLRFNPRHNLDADTRSWLSSIDRIPILSRSGMYLEYPNGLECEARRLARIMGETWQMLGLGTRRRLLGFWRKGGPVNMVCPQFELALGWPHQGGKDYGCCAHAGHTFRFWSPVLGIMPDNIVGILVAHELGHGYLAATGQQEYSAEEWADYYQGGWTYILEEEAVAFLLDRWGFEDSELDEWDARNASSVKALREGLLRGTSLTGRSSEELGSASTAGIRVPGGLGGAMSAGHNPAPHVPTPKGAGRGE